ncbi:MAG TPA: hypothetical protein EYP53_05340 [Candidatus Latescibacteria bacterium]|nr:hypothetical protein [Candidatus Latescibacterota bacterium]
MVNNPVTVHQILMDAEHGGYAVGGFDSYFMELIKAIVETADEESAPVILQASPKGLRYMGADFFQAMAEAALRRVGVPVAIHLDHGTSMADILLALRHGFTSVMIDGSRLPLEENIALTKRVVELAHSVASGVTARRRVDEGWTNIHIPLRHDR